MFPNLPVQYSQRVEYVVVKVAPEYKGDHNAAQPQGRAPTRICERHHDAALEPGKTFPLASLDMEILFQRSKRYGGRAGVAVRPQSQVNPEYKTMLGGVANHAVNRTHGLGEVLVVGDACAPLCVTRSFAILIVNVDQIDIAGDIEFTRTKLAHTDNPEQRALALRGSRHAVCVIKRSKCGGTCHIE